jgi:signal transduction histidine kinase
LLTPVTELRLAAENAIDWPDDPEATNNLAREVHDLSTQMEHIVRSLLAISRAEANLTPLKVETFDLREVAHDLLQSTSSALAARQLEVTVKLEEPLIVRTDEVIVRAILKNLVSNVVEYAVPSGQVVVEGTTDNGEVILAVSNSVQGLKPDLVERFLEPFWRADLSHESREHAGLGLALCNAYAQLLKARLSLRLEKPDLLRAELILPAIAFDRTPAPTANSATLNKSAA